MATVAHAEYQHEDVVPVLIPERGSSVIGSESTSASQAEGLMLEVDTSVSSSKLQFGRHLLIVSNRTRMVILSWAKIPSESCAPFV